VEHLLPAGGAAVHPQLERLVLARLQARAVVEVQGLPVVGLQGDGRHPPVPGDARAEAVRGPAPVREAVAQRVLVDDRLPGAVSRPSLRQCHALGQGDGAHVGRLDGVEDGPEAAGGILRRPGGRAIEELVEHEDEPGLVGGGLVDPRAHGVHADVAVHVVGAQLVDVGIGEVVPAVHRAVAAVVLAHGGQDPVVVVAVGRGEGGHRREAELRLQPRLRVAQLGLHLCSRQAGEVRVAERVAADLVVLGEQRLHLRHRQVVIPALPDALTDQVVGGAQSALLQRRTGPCVLRGPSVIQRDGDHPLGKRVGGLGGECSPQQGHCESPQHPTHEAPTAHVFPS